MQKYLDGWLRILGSQRPRVVFVDGFAGRGEFDDGSEGSPLIAMRMGQERSNICREMICIFVEKNENNFNNLKAVVKREQANYPFVKVEIQNDEFSNVVTEILDDLEEKGLRIAPAFFFIDPFGFSGVPMPLISRIMTQKRTEVFITFMARDLNRFLFSDRAQQSIAELFGNVDLSQTLEMSEDSDRRSRALLDAYVGQLKDVAGIRWVLPFNVMSEDRKETLYHLIHGSNHFMGYRLMKGIMARESELFSYLGPSETAKGQKQSVLDTFDDDALGEWLLKRYAGRRITFYDVLEESLEESGPCIDTHYRKVLKQLEKDGRVKIIRVVSKKTGLADMDEVEFPPV